MIHLLENTGNTFALHYNDGLGGDGWSGGALVAKPDAGTRDHLWFMSPLVAILFSSLICATNKPIRNPLLEHPPNVRSTQSRNHSLD